MHLLMVDIVGYQQRSKKRKDECFVFYLDDNFYFIFVGKFKAKFLEMNGLVNWQQLLNFNIMEVTWKELLICVLVLVLMY